MSTRSVRSTVLLLLLGALSELDAQNHPSAPAPYATRDTDISVVERGPHHRVWGRITWSTNRSGKVLALTNSYTELETGMHVLRNSEWQEANPQITVSKEGGEATNCAHQIKFAANLNVTNAVQLLTPDGRLLRSWIAGLGYYDESSGSFVLFARLQDTFGLIYEPNRVVYPDAFDALEADVEYINSKAGLEQNIVLRAQPPSPAKWGLNPNTTRLQVLTEFFDPPEPEKPQRTRIPPDGDETLRFGTMTMGRGKAFLVPLESGERQAIPVAKRWSTTPEGRTFLFEEVKFDPVSRETGSLPVSRRTAMVLPERIGHGKTLLAAVQEAVPRGRSTAKPGVMRLAKSDQANRPGFVLDYAVFSSTSDFTFKADTTYYCTNVVNLSGTTTFEGGTVVKFTTNSPTLSRISITGSVDCRSGPYRPVIITVKDDNTVGETISGSTGIPQKPTLGDWLVIAASDNTLKNFRISYASSAVTLGFDSGQLNLAHMQFVNSRYAIDFDGNDSDTVVADNCLFYSVTNCFNSGVDNIVIGQHLTVNDCHEFWDPSGGSNGELYLTNSLLVAVGSMGNLDVTVTDHTPTLSSAVGVFQTVGSAAHYLVDGSTNRNAGTTNIGSALLSELRKLSTYPPIVFSNVLFDADVELYPQAQRDTDAPDLGYHYDPLDYVFGFSRVTNATMTVLPGTAIGTFCGSPLYGLGILAGSTLRSVGSVTAPNWVAMYNTVQEQANLSWTNANGTSDRLLLGNWFSGSDPTIECRFTKFSALADRGTHFTDWTQNTLNWFTDCEFHGGRFNIFSSSAILTNCLFDRVIVSLSDDYWASGVNVRDCLFYGGTLGITHWDSGDYVFRNNLFDKPMVYQDGDVDAAWNGYTTGTTLLTPTNGVTNVVAALTFQAGPLGYFYQPTNSAFIDMGSDTADKFGLYHYTTTTNLVDGLQVKEEDSPVDIGYHYVALDGDNLPINGDGDWIPDYLEDANGDGNASNDPNSWLETCIEYGPFASEWTCASSVAVSSAGALNWNDVSICTGRSVRPVLTATPVFTPATMRRWINYDCNPDLDSYDTQPIHCLVGPLYFTLPNNSTPLTLSTFSTAGTYQYEAKVDIQPTPLVGWWSGDANGTELIYANSAALTNGATYGTGKVGHGFSLDGSDDRIRVEDSPYLNFGQNQNFSIECWIKVDSGFNHSVITIVDKRQFPSYEGAIALGYAFFLSNGKLACQLATGPSYGNFVSTGSDLRDGSFHHVALSVTRDSTTGGHLYVDGSDVLTFNPVSFNASLLNSAPLWIGAHADESANSYLFKGILDEVSIYACALSASEVAAIWDAGKGGKCWSSFGGSCAALPTAGVCSKSTVIVDTITVRVFGDAVDTDDDGRTDCEELADGTDPNSNTNVKPQRLAYWRFDGTADNPPTISLETTDGQSPPESGDANVTPETTSWVNYAAGLEVGAESTRYLSYDRFRAAGRPILTPRRGTVSLWFKPNWESGDDVDGNSSGNQARYILFALSQKGNNEGEELGTGPHWGVELDSMGEHLYFKTKSEGNAEQTLTQGAIDWQIGAGYENPAWHNIVLTYTESRVELYIDGELLSASDTTVLSSWPGSVTSGNPWRIWIGGILGQSLANGSYDEIETFNYPLSAQVITEKYQVIANLDSDHDGLTDLEELHLGTDPHNADSDGDQMPDGWEVKYGLNPKNNSDANGDIDRDAQDHPDPDGRSNLQEFLFGTNPLLNDDPISQALAYDLVADNDSLSNLFNIDFGSTGNKTAPTGTAGAGVGTNDVWTVIDDTKWFQEVADAEGSTGRGIQISMRYGPIYWSLVQDLGCTEYVEDCEALVKLGCSCPAFCGLDYGPGSTADYCIDIWRGLQIHQHQVGQEVYLQERAFDQPGSMTTVPGTVSEHAMFQDFSFCFRDTPADGEFVKYVPEECVTQTVDKSAAYGQIILKHLPGHNYRVYLYCSPAYTGLSWPQRPLDTSKAMDIYLDGSLPDANHETGLDNQFWVYTGNNAILSAVQYWQNFYGSGFPLGVNYWNGGAYSDWFLSLIPSNNEFRQSVRVPTGGQNLPNFVNGANYQRTFVKVQNGTLALIWGHRNAAINGLQLVELHPLAKASLEARALLGTGAMVQWDAVPQALAYEVFRKAPGEDQYKSVASSENRFYLDAVSTAGNYSYFVRAKNEVPAYTSVSDIASVTVEVPGSGGSGDPPVVHNHPPVLNSVQPLRQAFEGTPFAFGAPKIEAAAQAFDPEGTPLQFIVTAITSGTLTWKEPGANAVVLSNQQLQQDAQLSPPVWRIFRPGVEVTWTPSEGALGDVKAFSVQAFDGVNRSIGVAEVPINVKPQSVLLWWGNNEALPGNGISGNCLPQEGYRPSGSQNCYSWDRTQNSGFTKLPSPVRVADEYLNHPSVRDGVLVNVIDVKASGKWPDFLRVALTADGTVWVWGHGLNGTLGDSETIVPEESTPDMIPWCTPERTKAAPVPGLTQITSISVSPDGQAVLTVRGDGSVWGWGLKKSGRALSPSSALSLLSDEKAEPRLMVPYTATEWEQSASVGLTPYRVFWVVDHPVQLPGLENIVQVVCDNFRAAALDANGRVFTWMATGIMGDQTAQEIVMPEKIKQVAVGWYHTLALGQSGSVYVWGWNIPSADLQRNWANGASVRTFGIPSFTEGYTDEPQLIPGLAGVVEIGCSEMYSLARRSDGSVWEWGAQTATYNAEWSVYGNCYFPNPYVYYLKDAPSRIGGLENVVGIQLQEELNHAIGVDGYLYAWGMAPPSSFGGDSHTLCDTVRINHPVRINGLSEVGGVAFSSTDASGGPAFFAIGVAGSFAPENLRALPGDRQIQLVWDTLTGAQQYAIKRSSSQNGEYAWITTVPATIDLSRQVFTDRGLINGQIYYYKVSVLVNGQERDSDAAWAVPQALPATPTDLAATGKSRQIKLTWTRGLDADTYKIYRSLSAGGPFELLSMQANQVRLLNHTYEYIDSDVTIGDTYHYKVQAVNGTGASDLSSSVSAAPNSNGPGAPSTLDITAGETTVALVWEPVAQTSGNVFYVIRWAKALCDSQDQFDPAESAQNLKWEVVKVLAATPEAQSETYEVHGMTPGRCYAFSISVIDDTGEGEPSASQTTRLQGAATLEKIAVAGGPGTIYASWQCNADVCWVRLKKNGTLVANPCATMSEKHVIPDVNGLGEIWMTGLDAGSDYSLEVVAIPEDPDQQTTWISWSVPQVTDGSSVPSPTSIYFPMKPLKAYAANNRIELSWWGSTDAEAAESARGFADWHFILQRKVSGATGSGDFPCEGFQVIAESDGGLRFTDKEVENATAYVYRLVGISPTREVYERTLGDDGVSDTSVTPAESFSGATISLTANALNAAVQLVRTINNYTVPTDGSVKIEFLFTLDPEEDDGFGNEFPRSWKSLGDATTTSTLTHGSLANGKTYYYKAKATHVNGDALESQEVAATPLASQPLPPPDGFSGDVGVGRITIRWQGVAGASTYQVEKWQSGTTYGSPSFVTKPELTDTLGSGTTDVYQYRILAMGAQPGLSVVVRAVPLSWTWPPNPPPNPAYTPVSFKVERQCSGGDWLEIARTPYLRYVDVRAECLDATVTYRATPIQADGELTSDVRSPVQVTSSASGLDAPPASVNEIPPDEQNVEPKVEILELSSAIGDPTSFTTPTNILLRASADCVVDRVDFYVDGSLLGSSRTVPPEITWFSPGGTVDGRTYRLIARAVDAEGRTKDSPSYFAEVKTKPPLNAYTTSTTDIELPATGLPLNFSRSYDSRDTRSGLLGKGWKSSWDRARILVPRLDDGWKARQTVLSVQPINVQETRPHRIEVTLPDGAVEYYRLAPALQQNTPGGGGIAGTSINLDWLLDDLNDFDDKYSVPLAFYSEGGAAGTLEDANGPVGMEFDLNDLYGNGGVTSLFVDGVAYAPTAFKYTSPEGLTYEFGLPEGVIVNNEELTELCLLSIKDRNGNEITYDVTLSGGSRVFGGVSHSNGRSLKWQTGSEGNSGYWCVYDGVSPAPNGTPVLRYKVEDDLLTEVGRLKSRTGTPEYETTQYEYFSGFTQGKEALNGLLRRVVNPEGVIELENDYFGTGSGESTSYLGYLRSQTNAVGAAVTLDHQDQNNGDLKSDVVTTVPIDESTTETSTGTATFNSAGQLASVEDELQHSSTTAYDAQGRPVVSADAAGNTKLYEYDSQNRPIRVTDELGNQTEIQYGPFDQPLVTKDAAGNETHYEYYHYAIVHAENDPNPEGMLRSVTDPARLTTEYTYNFRGQTLTEARRVPGTTDLIKTTYEYYEDRDSTEEANGDPGDLKRVMEPLWPGQLDESDPQYNANSKLYTTEYTYDANGNRATEKRYRMVVSRDSNGDVNTSPNDIVQQTVTTTYTYDTQNRLLTTIISAYREGESNEDLQTTLTEYNPATGKPKTTTDAYGRQTEMVYDVRGNLIQTTYPDGSVSRTVYDGKGRAIWQQERSKPATGTGAPTTAPATFTEYDQVGRVIKTKRFANVTVQKQETTAVTEGNLVTSASSQYRKKSTVSAVTQYYTVVTSPTDTTSGFSSITRTEYDNVGRVKYSMDARGTVTAYGYDAAGKRTSVTNYTVYLVNPLVTGNLTPSGDLTHTWTTNGFDAVGNQTWVKDALGRQTEFEYDIMNRRTVTRFPLVTGETGRKATRTVYDGLGRRAQEIDEAGIATAFGYDLVGRLTSVTNDWKSSYAAGEDPLVTTYAYDEFGNQISQMDAKGNLTKYEYDALGRRTHRFLPGTTVFDEVENAEPNHRMEKVTYNKVPVSGTAYSTLSKEIQDFRGKKITLDYDILERLKTKTLPIINGESYPTLISYEYSDVGQLDQVETSVNSTVTRTTYYAYDELRRLKRKDTPEGVVAYSYTANGGNVETMKGYRRSAVSVNADPGSATADVDLTYAYDTLGRLHTVTDNKLSTPNQTTYAYDAVGNLDYYTYPNGVKHDYDYTEQNRLKTLLLTRSDDTLLRHYEYDLNATGQRTGVIETHRPDSTEVTRRHVVYEYDQDYTQSGVIVPRVNRLTRETLFEGLSTLAGRITHAYDRVGNRTSRTVTDLTFTPAENLGDQYLTFEERDLITTATYDHNGNSQTDENGTAMGDLYDAENRLIQRGSDTIKYDHEGNRVQKTFGGVTTYYLLDDRNLSGYVQVLAQYVNTANAPTRAYTYGHDLIAQRLDGSTTHYYGYDGHGSVRLLTDSATGSSTLITDTYDYDAYGRLLAITGATPNHYLYTGEQWDGELGMYFLRARYYRPDIGRFWTMDSFEGNSEDPLSLHKYLYAHGNPVMMIDPSGHDGSWSTVGMLAINSISAGMNAWSAAANIRAGNYGRATVDLIGAGLSIFGLWKGGPPTGLFGQYAMANGIALSSAQMAAIAKQLKDAASVIGASIAVFEVSAMAANSPSPLPPSGSSGSSGNSDDELDWSITSDAGETRAAHVNLHAVNNLQKELHGVFYGDPVSVIKEAWKIKVQNNLPPVNPGGTVDIYLIPRANAGWEGGYAGSGKNLDSVLLIVKDRKKVITGFPVGGVGQASLYK